MDEPALELRYDAEKTKWGLPVCILAATLGFALLVTKSDDVMSMLVGGIFLIVGIRATIEYLRRQRDGSVVLRIGPEGILDRRLSRHLIAWHDIIALNERVTWGKRRQWPYLDLHLKKTARITAGWPVIFWRMAGARGFPISDEGLEGTFHQIFRAAKYYADRRGVPFYIQGRPQPPGPI